jgi:hypothetical protein
LIVALAVLSAAFLQSNEIARAISTMLKISDLRILLETLTPRESLAVLRLLRHTQNLGQLYKKLHNPGGTALATTRESSG